VSHPDPPIVGASDIGHGFTWPETGIQAWELIPGPLKTKTCMVRGSNPGPAKYYNRVNCNVQNNAIAWIAKIRRNTNCHVEHDHDIHMECIHWTTDNSQTNKQRPDHLKMGDSQTVPKMLYPSKNDTFMDILDQ